MRAAAITLNDAIRAYSLNMMNSQTSLTLFILTRALREGSQRWAVHLAIAMFGVDRICRP
jgi:hypothetical protein